MSHLNRNQVSRTIGNAAVDMLGPNSHRKALLISPPVAGTAFISFDGDASATNGITVPSTATPFILTGEDFWCAIQQRVSVIIPAGNSHICMVEISDNAER